MTLDPTERYRIGARDKSGETGTEFKVTQTPKPALKRENRMKDETVALATLR